MIKKKKEKRKVDLIEVKHGKNTYTFNSHESYMEWLKKQNKPPEPLDNIDMTEIINLCKENIKSVFETGYEVKDVEHWLYEQAMEAVYGQPIWNWLNEHNEE